MKKKLSIALLLGFLLFLLSILTRNDYLEKDEEVLLLLEEKGIKPLVGMIPYGKDSIRSFSSGDSGKPKILLIHGSPGGWSDWVNIFVSEDLHQDFQLIAFDRPGYGMTSVAAQSTLKGQANVASAVIEHYRKENETFLIVGHSFGGAVVEQLLLDYPKEILGAVFVAATLSPEAQETKWYNKLGDLPLINLLPGPFIQSSNVEMMGLSESLLANETKISTIYQRLSYIQGEEDMLVPFETATYFKNLHPEGVDYIIEKDMNHFVPWSHPKLIIEAINSFYE